MWTRSRFKTEETGKMIKKAELSSSSSCSGMRYYIYQREDGSIYGETLSAVFDIADSMEEFEKIPLQKLESLVYSAEMTISR